LSIIKTMLSVFLKLKRTIKHKLRERFFPQNGQLLIEVIVAMAVGGGLLLAASAAIVSVIRQNYESRGAQTASSYAYDLISRIKEYTNADWHNVHDLDNDSSNKYFIVSSATSSVAVAGQESVFSNDIAAGLVGHWKMDENAGLIAYDSSGSGNNGTLINGPTRESGTNCRASSCLNLIATNSNYVISTGNVFNPSTTDFTASLWFNTNIINSLTILIGQQDLDGTGRSWLYIDSSGHLYTNLGGTTTNGITPLSAGLWYHGVVVKSGTSISLYLNGSLEAISTSTVESTTGLTMFGTNKSLAGNFFDGKIDDVRIYSRALSENEISQLYSSSVYSRYFYVGNVSRTGCGVVNITSDSNNSCTNIVDLSDPTDYVADDSSTQKITAVVTRTDGGSYQFYDYVTRNRNSVFTQNNWSGGNGQDGPITVANDKYSTSTNITASTNLSLTSTSLGGTLESSTFDTQSVEGAAYNNIIWNGTTNDGSVKFQIASSNSTSTTGGTPTGFIDPVYRYAWNDYIGWLDFGYGAGSVAVESDHLSGYAYNVNVGEISLDCATSPHTPEGNICDQSSYRVFHSSSTGDLSGWAWNDEIGWISFNCADPDVCETSNYKVNASTTNGMFTGYAWNDIVGWISFNCADPNVCGTSDYKVSTAGASGWSYNGPGGTSLSFDVYTAASDSSMTINPAYHNNYRYFRYKVILSPNSGHTTSPTVTGININWSP
jgi:hypothetical protein